MHMPSTDFVPLEVGCDVLTSKGFEPLELILEKSTTREAKEKAINHHFKAKTFMELYTIAFVMSTQRTQNLSPQLYDFYEKRLATYLTSKVVPTLQQKTGPALLKEFSNRWQNHTLYIKKTTEIFQYLDRFYVKAQGKPTLEQKGLEVFYQKAFLPHSTALIKALLEWIDFERDGESVDGSIVKSLSDMMTRLEQDSVDVYKKFFEDELILSTRDYFQKASLEWLEESSFTEYLKRVESCLEVELRHCRDRLRESTQPKVAAVIQKVLLGDHVRELLSKDQGILRLLQQNDRANLRRAHDLFGLLLDGHELVAAELRSFIASEGNAIVDNFAKLFASELASVEGTKQSRPLIQKQLTNMSVVTRFIELHDFFLNLVEECFPKEVYHRAVKLAFGEFLNKPIGQLTMAAFLATYCDQVFRNKAHYKEPEGLLTKVVALFGYLAEKDIFYLVYRNQLARRLLHENSTSIELETAMLAKLKEVCGAAFTQKLDGMLADIATSHDIKKEFKASLRAPCSDLLKDSFGVVVISAGLWPTYQTPTVELPPEMAECVERFTEFYVNEKTTQRKLTWIHHLGSVVVEMQGKDRNYHLACNTFQACILVLFNSSEVLTLTQIVTELGLEETTTSKLLVCLALAKILVARKNDEGTETYMVNTDFTSKHRYVRVPIPIQDEVQAREKVEEDRTHTIDAAIVRIMKMQKTMRHQNLVNEVIQKLAMFTPVARVVKLRIEALIERDFIKRDPADVSFSFHRKILSLQVQLYHYAS